MPSRMRSGSWSNLPSQAQQKHSVFEAALIAPHRGQRIRFSTTDRRGWELSMTFYRDWLARAPRCSTGFVMSLPGRSLSTLLTPMSAAGVQPDPEEDKRRATALSLGFNALQSLLKIGAAVLTGSVSVLSEAVHSSTDLVASMMAFVGVRAAAAPPDEEHPYGHGKIESLAGFGESILLFCIVIYICAESVTRLLHKPQLEKLDLGLVVMTVSAIGCLLVSRYVTYVANKTKSLALRSNGRHLLADFVTSLGVLAALAGTKFTGWGWLDPAIAILLALWMCFGAWMTAQEAFQHLIDRRLEDGELAAIQRLVEENKEVLGYHRLRSRLSGDMRYVDMHIVLPSNYSLIQAHAVADELEKKIAFELAPAQVVIHVDPYDEIKAQHEERISRKTDPRPQAPDTGR